MGTYFKGGWFSKAKTSDTFEAQALEWAGVESQFFSIIGKALVPVDTAVWASHFPVQIPGVKEEAKAKSNAIEVALGLPRLPLKAGDQQTHVYDSTWGRRNTNASASSIPPRPPASGREGQPPVGDELQLRPVVWLSGFLDGLLSLLPVGC
ncbi:MAG: hypothetical protein R3F31_09005 [Verrucomicrobiales bacterium]